MRLYVQTDTVADAGHLFAGLNVGDIERVKWRSEENPDDRGEYWVAPADGVWWVSDGESRFAVAVRNRVFRFFHRGIPARLLRLLRRYAPKGIVPIHGDDVVINFGANIGELAVALTRFGAKVIAIEPDPNVIPALRFNAQGHPIKIVHCAAWNSDGPLKMYLKTETADTSAFNVSDHPVTVEARRIDSIIPAGRIHLLVGDAEGAEPEVLEGARETLKRTSYVSVCASDERNGQSTQAACEAILRDGGFDIIHKENGGFGMLIGRNPCPA